MSIIQKWNSISLVKRIVCGLIIGAILGLLIPQVKVIGVLGTLFVGALKAVAPILVFFLVIAALACGQEGGGQNNGPCSCTVPDWYIRSGCCCCIGLPLHPHRSASGQRCFHRWLHSSQAALVKYSPIC